MSRKLRIGLAGLGRMGARHAHHFHALTPRADLVAVCSPAPHELKWAHDNLPDVQTYTSFEEMLEKENELEAVVIASITAAHAEQAIQAMQKGLHVLCEKPLSVNAEISQTVVDAYATSITRFPSQKVMCGFSRRFDASYQDAHQKMSAGLIGRPVILRSQTCDKRDPSGFFIAFAESSGGIFVDCSVHDIDLALWFFGEDSVVKSVSAVGTSAVSPGLDEHNDRDNAVGIVEFWGGKIAYFYTSRMMAAGQEDSTEIIGTDGKLTVNMQPQMNLVNIYESTGIRREIPQHYYDRFKEALIREANEFVACCLDDKDLPLKLSGAVSAVKIGHALQESMISGKKLDFDEKGFRIPQPEVQARL